MRHPLRSTILPLLLLLAAAAPAATPVPLAPQPGSVLDRAARSLLASDLEDARRNHDKPLVLVGTAKLGAASDRPALFVQLQSARMCGSAGCSTSVFLWRGGAYKRVLDGVGGKLSVASTKHRGMFDLVSDEARFVWNGTEYQDTRPAPAIDLRPRRR